MALRLRPPGPAAELLALVMAAWIAFISVPLALGGIGLGWDALNHHVYLGWVAESERFDRDLLAANTQAFQYPYLYWPMYKLLQMGVSGRLAGVVLASLNSAVVPALWLLARSFVPERSWHGAAMRLLALLLAWMTGVALAHLDATPNDLLAAIPLVWAVALAIVACEDGRSVATSHRLVLASGACAGMAVAFKLSNGPLALVMPVLWWCAGRTVGGRLAAMALASLGCLLSFLLFYGYWGWLLWRHHGNPVYPFYDAYFVALRGWFGLP